jgi:hypothetical protein
MKKSLLLILLIVFVLGQVSTAQTGAKSWNTLSDKEKDIAAASILMGWFGGMEYTANSIAFEPAPYGMKHTVSFDDSSIKTEKALNADRREFIKGLKPKLLVPALDHFYSDPRNKDMPLYWAIDFVMSCARGNYLTLVSARFLMVMKCRKDGGSNCKHLMETIPFLKCGINRSRSRGKKALALPLDKRPKP